MTVDKKERELIFHIDNVDCPTCALRFEKSLDGLSGIRAAHVSVMTGELSVQLGEGFALADVARILDREGHPIDGESVQSTIIKISDGTYESYRSALSGYPSFLALKQDSHEQITISHLGTREDLLAFLAPLGGKPASEEGEFSREAAPRPHWLITHRRPVMVVIALTLWIAATFLNWLEISPLGAILCFLAAILIAGLPTLTRAVRNILLRRIDMYLLMTLAVLGATWLGDFSEAAMVLILFAVAEWLEERSGDRARHAVETLIQSAPTTANLLAADKTVTVISADRVPLGATILIRPGERIPVDGRVTTGSSHLDLAMLTGESLPQPVGIGDRVLAGGLNREGVLEAVTESVGKDTAMGHMIARLREAQASRAPVSRAVDRFAAWYTPLVVVGAALVAILPPLLMHGDWGVWLYRSLVMLTIGCPCALVIATPVTIVAALTRAARDGVLIKGAAHLESLARIDTLVLDKTGTLTEGRPSLAQVLTVPGVTEGELLSLVGGLSAQSPHPLLSALPAVLSNRGLAPAGGWSNVKLLPGMGMEAMRDDREYLLGNSRLLEKAGLTLPDLSIPDGYSEVWAARGMDVLGVLLFHDPHRAEIPATLDEFRSEGLTLHLYSGDKPSTVERVARECGITSWRGGMLPEEKHAAVRDLQAAGHRVAMVGDGTNDAPALAGADVGIALRALGSEVALEAADVALMSGELAPLARTIRLARKALGRVWSNMALALALKLGIAILAILGFGTLWMAVLADTGASLLVTARGLMLLRDRKSM